jgi:hypothetical protein
MSRLRRFILKFMALLLMAAIISFTAQPAHAQQGITVEGLQVSVNFGKTITFQAKIKAPLPIKQASILFRGVSETVTRVETLQVAEDGSVSFTYDASLNLIPPFSSMVVWFQATLSDEKTYTSDPVTFPYNDQRFPWRTTSSANVTIHWYAGDDAFGAAALDAAGAGMLAMREFVPVSLTDPIDIYIYSNDSDLQNTLALGGQQWVGGHADPQLGVVLVAIEPGPNQSIDLETKIPHELTHVMMYRSLGESYARQPLWLLEGIASMVELYPNLEYKRALEDASQKNNLLAFSSLCTSFPADAGNAFLAYAQSQSFVTYIRDSYGTSGLARLTQSYGDNFDCELGAANALGIPLSQLDKGWRESVLGQNETAVAIRNLSPFVLLLILILVVPLWGAVDMLRLRRQRGKQS